MIGLSCKVNIQTFGKNYGVVMDKLKFKTSSNSKNNELRGGIVSAS